LHNTPITAYGEGTQTRSFCYIDDLIEGIVRAMKSRVNIPVNLGNPDEFTILELAKLVIKLTGSKSKIIFKHLPEDDPQQRRPDITLAKRSLRWQPEINLKEGLLRTIAWFQSNPS
jgi:UDP-glucuronate decarboxylase